ncbi:hypothetical protein F5884DRAFT_299370 [Xylogone sp. PMI_703]|nr:hypothetical protein F5884DRAFT_299370 [Xylogone sp. PMI_703]
MAQPQQQQQQLPMPQRPFSPPQSSTSPGTPQQFSLPPNKRQRLSPTSTPQPTSPYVQSPYSMPPSLSTPGSTNASPHFVNIQLPQGVYNTPYANGNTTPSLSLPQTQPNLQSPPVQGSLNFPNQAPYQAGQHPNFNNFSMPMGPGSMGPPSKPIEKDKKEDGVDPMDVLGGTGIDLREEEQYTFQLNASFNSSTSGSQVGNISASHSFTQFPPGDESSFYGSGPANQPGEVPKESQDEFGKKAADKAWHDAARNLAISRQRELDNPFLNVVFVHKKMEKVAWEMGLRLNTDMKGSMGTMKLPEHFQDRTVHVQTAVGPNGILTGTQGMFLPADSLLVDQLALLSIATKHRLRGLIEDATKLAKGRQTGSHGIVTGDFADIAVPSNVTSGIHATEDAPRSGWEGSLSPSSNLKRPANSMPTPVSDGAKTPNGEVKFSNEVVSALRTSAAKEREYEEARLRKRRARTTGDGTPRQGSIAPGTPGSVAPEPSEKAPTKKEQKKKAEAKVNEAASHAAANVTTAQFLGGGGGLFGKKKKYSWMTGGAPGGPGSGASTPGRIMTQGLPGTPSGIVAPVAPERLTTDGVRRLGTWREDHEKGQGIQIRDWISVLEDDGREKRALQKAYMWLDQSEPK